MPASGQQAQVNPLLYGGLEPGLVQGRPWGNSQRRTPRRAAAVGEELTDHASAEEIQNLTTWQDKRKGAGLSSGKPSSCTDLLGQRVHRLHQGLRGQG